MPNARILATVLTIALAARSAAGLAAQSAAAGPQWETLAQAPLPEGVEPNLSINSLTLPAEPVPRITQPHTTPARSSPTSSREESRTRSNRSRRPSTSAVASSWNRRCTCTGCSAT